MFHVIVNAISIGQHVIQIKNGIIKHVKVNVEIIESVKKVIAVILAHVFKGNSKYFKNIADTAVITCDEIISVMDTVSTKMTNSIATNGTSFSSINSHSKKSKI